MSRDVQSMLPQLGRQYWLQWGHSGLRPCSQQEKKQNENPKILDYIIDSKDESWVFNRSLESPDRGSDDDASQTRQAHVEAYCFQPQIGNRHDITWSGNNHPTSSNHLNIQFSVCLSSFVIIDSTIQRKTPREPEESVTTGGNWRYWKFRKGFSRFSIDIDETSGKSAVPWPICHGTALRASGCGEGGPPPRWNGRWENSTNSTESRPHQTSVSLGEVFWYMGWD